MFMPSKRLAHEEILLFGLDDALASELGATLALDGRSFRLEPHAAAEGMRAAVQPDVDLVFCSAEKESCTPLLDFLRQEKPELPVVVVSRNPTTEEWLDAIEMGATDYCSPPFERPQISWVIDSALKFRRPVAA
jgi:DNA-binding NtrC family response regulator